MTAFKTPFDEAMADVGPPAVFVRDPAGSWKLEATWTRDAWGRVPAPVRERVHAVLRDRATGMLVPILATGAGLFDDHPRLEVRTFQDEAAMWAFYVGAGSPPIDRSPW